MMLNVVGLNILFKIKTVKTFMIQKQFLTLTMQAFLSKMLDFLYISYIKKNIDNNLRKNLLQYLKTNLTIIEPTYQQ